MPPGTITGSMRDSQGTGAHLQYPISVCRFLPLVLAAIAASPAQAESLSSLSFDELSQIRIVTASKVPLALSETPAAVYVLTGEEIKRLGANSFPQALRYAPGIDVGQISTYQWSVSARGFNGQFANQLLVLLDGRTILNPNNGGVSWFTHDTFFPDLDRIEVVRGPGSSLWGTNAVNGVINILTKDASQTQGFASRVGGGNLQPLLLSARQGFKLSEQTHLRVYAKANRFSGIPLSAEQVDQGEWDRNQIGFRLDSKLDADTHFTVQGDAFRTDSDTIYPFPLRVAPYSKIEYFRTHTHGANLLATWKREMADGAGLQVRGYYDTFHVDGEASRQKIDIVDLDAQHTLRPRGAHRLTFGANARGIFSTIPETRVIRVPGRPRAYDQLYSLFAQDEITLPGRMALTLGTRAEHNSYTGWEYSPNARLGWKASEHHFFWAAASHAVTTPTQFSTGIAFDSNARPPGIINRIIGAAESAEHLQAVEMGWRFQPTSNVFVDVTAFHNYYHDLLFIDRSAGVLTGGYLLQPWRNGLEGETRGGELALGWDPVPFWRLKATFSHLDSNVTGASVGRGDKGSSPRNKASLHCSFDLPADFEFDFALRYVGALTNPAVPAYNEADARLSWHASSRWTIEIVGQNLLHRSHIEAARGFNPIQSTIPRSVFFGVEYRH
ncbi:TonB-dependent receptor plug domain-containing protein [Nibricoccus sp. IMCC34717]|uniref:TonB-dependent receptor plug domain-containing protein n=1 Tax=Nibricoccus sp. IMCC34717 TaxID=3034021 RepID=UPI00384D906B